MFALNKTSEWLENLPQVEKILQMSVTEGRELRKPFQDKCHIIEETRRRL